MLKIRDLPTNRFIYKGPALVRLAARAITEHATVIKENYRKYFWIEIFVDGRRVNDLRIESRERIEDELLSLPVWEGA